MKKVLFALSFMVLVGLQALAQTTNVTGTVTDAADGFPIPGVSVFVKGTTIGTVTTPDGTYTLSVPNDAAAIVFSFVGMTTQEVAYTGQTTIDAVMQSEAMDVDEVLVVAYGTAKKSTFTGSAVQMKAEELEQLPVATVTDALQGKSTGLQINSSSGDPGSGSTVRIRGIGSLNAASDPLYVIDGVAVNAGNVSELSDGGDDLAPTDVLSTINPNDIESMTVLKDASATAIYGARAANGVILITTKKGKKGQRAQITFDAKWGVTQLPPGRGYDLMSSADHYKTYFDAYMASGLTAAEANAETISALANNNPYNVAAPLGADGNPVSGARIITDTDWVDEVFRNGSVQEYNLSARGGSEKTTYFLSFGYSDTEGIVTGSEFSRYSTRINLESELTDWVTVGTNTSLSFTDQTRTVGAGAGAAATRNALLYPNAVSVYEKDADGNVIVDGSGNPVYNFVNPVSMDFNPLFTVDNDIYNTKNYRVLSSAYGIIDFSQFVEGLKFRTDNSIDFYTVEDFQFYNPFHGNAAGDLKGRGYSYGTWNSLWSSSNKLLYNKSMGAHTFDVLAGFEASENTTRGNMAHATGYAVYGDVVLPALANAANYQGASSYEDKWSMYSWIARVNYDFNDKYYLSASFRNDASSRFGANKRNGSFYSLGGSWRITQENFMSDVNWIDNLKLRASYGTSGNDQIGLYDYTTNFSSWNYDGMAGNALFKPGNPDLSWESSKSTTIGIDYTVLNGRLDGSIEWYNRVTSDLLYEVPISMVSGFENVIKNSAEIKNSGVEFNINYTAIQNTNFTWNIGLNYTANTNEITYLPTEEQINGTKIWREGGSIYDFYLREYAGVDETTGSALYYKDIEDEEGNPTGERELTDDYNTATRYVVGTSQPDGYGGLNNVFTYKGLSLSANLFFSHGGEILDVVEADLVNDGNDKGFQLSNKQLNSWKQAGDQTDVPVFQPGVLSNSNGLSTRYMYDATFMKLKTVTLSYQFPRSITDKLRINNLSVYASGNNLWVWTKDSDFEGFDPEVGLNGLTNYVTPNPTTMVFGVKIGL
ncbi:SusC/RagA family TonB-linked outer membrane protein [Carboxylicivirga sp. RSCT41]|uniref:SusC/RagA family TonB-linked outer membrane protein n=1 Tax=Carboxylicivirga agarovorans TaxID=3417570 RepID=UPI003D3273E4